MINENQKIIEAYEESVVEEGLIRRLGSKVVGAFSKPSLKQTNKQHEFAKSVAYDVGKDVAKVFGGDINKHTQEMYNLILDYLKKNSLNT